MILLRIILYFHYLCVLTFIHRLYVDEEESLSIQEDSDYSGTEHSSLLFVMGVFVSHLSDFSTNKTH